MHGASAQSIASGDPAVHHARGGSVASGLDVDAAAHAAVPGGVASARVLRPEPFFPGVGFVAVGLFLSVVVVKERSLFRLERRRRALGTGGLNCSDGRWSA